MNDGLYSISGMKLFPFPQKKKKGKINLRLTEKLNTLGFRRPRLALLWVIFPFLPRFGEWYDLPQELAFHLAEHHRFTHEIACWGIFFLVTFTFKTDVSHPPTKNTKEWCPRPFFNISSYVKHLHHPLLGKIMTKISVGKSLCQC